MKTSLPCRVALLAAVSFLPAPALRSQGPLTPPGAPAPTMKTLDQIEPRTPISALPFTINSPGSYYITGNLTGVANQHGITINADNVTLDLGGFELVGPGSGVTTAIRLVNAHVNATIRNGTVRGWLSSSVVAETVAGTELHVENLRVFGSGSAGIVLGNNGTAKGCEVRGSVATGISGGTSCKIIECTSTGQTGAGGDGINIGVNGLVLNCVASGNGGDGIQTGGVSTITGCTATGNTGIGFNAGTKCTLQSCVAQGNGTIGISCSAESTLGKCTAANNGSDGILGLDGCSLENCSASDNADDGFDFTSAVTMNNCTAYRNGSNGIQTTHGATLTNCSATLSSSEGFLLLGDSFTLNNCSAYDNVNTGILGNNAGTLANCSAESNGGAAGIAVSSGCTLTHCSARLNSSALTTTAGIFTGSRCHISRCSVSNTTSTAATLTATTGMGINVGADCIVEHCVAVACKGDGIHCGGGCVILSNLSNANGNSTGDGAGIHTTAGDVRVEGNTVVGNDRGIQVENTGSLIIKNDADGNTTDYVIAASNRYGAIINITAAGAAAVSGNTAASTVASTDPWANFSH